MVPMRIPIRLLCVLALSCAVCMPYANASSYKVTRSDDTAVLEFFANGNATAYGTVQTNATTGLVQDETKTELVIETASQTVARLDQTSGVFYLRGQVSQNVSQTVLNSYKDNTSGEFMVEDSNDDIVAVIDNSGNLLLKGTLQVLNQL